MGLAARVPFVASALVRLTGAVRLERRATGTIGFPFVSKQRLPRFLVLGYHRVNDGGHPFFPGTPTSLFRRQMEILGRSFTVLPLEELVERAVSNEDVPPNAVAITFDDGYRDNYTHAFPVLRELGFPATVFLVTEAVDGNRLIWHDRVFDAFHRTRAPQLSFDGACLSLRGGDQRREALSRVLGILRRSSPAERDARIDGLARALGVEPPGGEDWEKLGWDEVREMATFGIRFGAHTLDHPILSRLDEEEQRRQIRESKRRIESELGCEITAFAYPNGRREDFDTSSERLLREEGFRCAVTTLAGPNDASTDPFLLRRVGMWGDDPHLACVRLAWWRFAG